MTTSDRGPSGKASFPGKPRHAGGSGKERGGGAAGKSFGNPASDKGPRASRPQSAPHKQPADSGRDARDCAVEALVAVLHTGRSFDDTLMKSAKKHNLAPRDRAFARAVAAAALRNRGALSAVLTRFLQKGMPKDSGRLENILLAAAAQLLILETPPHAAISLAVDQVQSDGRARRYDKLANAVLRRVSEQGAAILKDLDAAPLNVPAWLYARWQKSFGDAAAHAIAAASLQEADLDLSVKGDAALWAEKLGGTLLPSGTVRLAAGGRIEDLAGYQDGGWWVQDFAAAIPARLLGAVEGQDVLDLCAAPGGKTAQLAAAGAHVTAVDQTPERLERLEDNLKRLNLKAQLFAADARTFAPGRLFDAVLVDAPCTATGTIRRHPDILHLKRPEDVAQLAAIQGEILSAAAKLVKPGGRLVYCTCSLEPDEGLDQIAAFLARHSGFARQPIVPGSLGITADLLTADGDLRTLPSSLAAPERPGMDGFYAALLVRNA